VRVGVKDGLKSESVVNTDHLLTVTQDQLKIWLGRLDEARMREVCHAAEVALGCR
jgi:mRNA-degrading endonuclease toxin of MazEF toxin-antitoxin module